MKFGSKPFVDNELYKIHCNLSYLGGIPSQYIYMQQNSVRPRTARHTLKNVNEHEDKHYELHTIIVVSEECK